LDSAGAEPYILPLGLETALTQQELDRYHSLVVDAFPGMLAIGGGDIDPALYGESVAGARDILPARDRVEASLIRRYTQSERGMFYGICRGSQLCAATLGFRLNQDLPTSQPNSRVAHAVGAEGARDAAHQSEWHSIEVSEESRFLRPALGRARIQVNSRHHQAVLESPNPLARVVARADDGTVEAMEFVNGRGALFQFHPEDMGTEDSARILQAMVRTARQRARERVGDCLRSALSGLKRR
jgi:putative glutamine amidotransferase